MPRESVGDTEAYRAICSEHLVPLFHQPWWLDAVCQSWIGVVAEGPDGTTALWPVPLETKLGVRMTRTPALTPYLGPAIVRVKSDAHGRVTAVNDELIEQLLGALPSIPVWHASAAPGSWNTPLFESAGFIAGRRPTYLLQLAGRGEGDLFTGQHAQTRRAVRRASETIVIASEPDKAEAMYAFQRITHDRKGARVHYSLQDFAALVKASHERGCGALWVARNGGEIIGAQWSLWDDRCCYNLGLARAETEAGKFVATGLLWHAIMHAHRLGLEVFDFEGSSIPTIAQFFSRFGGTMQPYLTLQKNDSLLWKVVRCIRP